MNDQRLYRELVGTKITTAVLQPPVFNAIDRLYTVHLLQNCKQTLCASTLGARTGPSQSRFGYYKLSDSTREDSLYDNEFVGSKF